jgi:hypothetical protein
MQISLWSLLQEGRIDDLENMQSVGSEAQPRSRTDDYKFYENFDYVGILGSDTSKRLVLVIVGLQSAAT